MVWQWLKYCKNHHKGFFVFTLIVASLYLSQLLFKFEITPLGYFSLYSQYTPKLPYYEQILPVDEKGQPINIYEAPGTGFILREILPTRYWVINNSPNGQPLSDKMQKLGLHFHSEKDCLNGFPKWYKTWLKANGHTSVKDSLFLCRFNQGQLIQKQYVQ
jgi:hypothetical protein